MKGQWFGKKGDRRRCPRAAGQFGNFSGSRAWDSVASPRFAGSSIRERQGTHPNAAGSKNRNTAFMQIGFERRQTRYQPVKIRFSACKVRLPEQDEGGPISRPKCQDCGKVGISRHENSILFASSRKNDFVTRMRQADIANMHGIVAGSAEERCEPRRQRIIDQKLQTEYGTGSSRSRTEAAA